MSKLLWADRGWIGGRWERGVVLELGDDGHWVDVQVGATAPPDGARVLAGPVLPGFVDAHSHAFQRAFAGLAERRDSAHDDFWSWRDRMYDAALRVDLAAMSAVAEQLYTELLRGGYTEVCEFHYLHHDRDGTPYDDPGAMAWALADAADAVGIGFTLLPVLYERAGFTDPSLRDDQRRFATDASFVLSLQEAAHARGVRCGLAIHSLRAAGPASIEALLAGARGGPIHIHVAEQTGRGRGVPLGDGMPADRVAHRPPAGRLLVAPRSRDPHDTGGDRGCRGVGRRGGAVSDDRGQPR